MSSKYLRLMYCFRSFVVTSVKRASADRRVKQSDPFSAEGVASAQFASSRRRSSCCCKAFIVAIHVILFFCSFAAPCFALEPAEILVIANKDAWDSVKLAKYYMKKRGVPKENLVRLRVTDQEHCSREEYDKDIALPVRKYLDNLPDRGKIKCLLIMYGMPLKISPPALTKEERKKLEELDREETTVKDELERLGQGNDREKQLQQESKRIQKEKRRIRKSTQSSSLDSEIALVMNDAYPLGGWLPNPLFVGYGNKRPLAAAEKTLMVCRLDGPTEQTVRRIIDESFEVEHRGLKGTAYFDARWEHPGKDKVTGYAAYDRSIHRIAAKLKTDGKIPVVLETTNALFQQGGCPEAALYCGWYSLANYVDAFEWVPGAVGYHIASSECSTLKRESSRVWCKKMLEEGAAATIGPVSEPYVQAFPLPEIFFDLLTNGSLTLAECYALSTPYWSWRMVLIGDPLYSPFKNAKGSER